jgi:lipopolysaccharide transport system ATP-binding protein
MNEVAIKVEGISKKYRLLHKNIAKSDSLMESASRWAKELMKQKQASSSVEEFWALKDISFEINKGDRVGVIGRNGAGKSTLLKVLSRIVLPTSGRIEYTGRMASLLEVGTGFHGDLSGRENIYLNGSILGMSKQEIDRKFDEIVEFSEVEKFLDTPVKRYSSGMYVRLAFAIAAHLEPEILIVDEVLAVGDAAFQKKCLGKMEDVSTKEGRTILFVSHNMPSLTNLCNKGIVLKNGMIHQPLTSVNEAVRSYVDLLESNEMGEIATRTDRQGEGAIRFTDFYVRNAENEKTSVCSSGDTIRFCFEYQCAEGRTLNGITFAIAVYGTDGTFFTLMGNEFSSSEYNGLHGTGTVSCLVEKWPLTSGRYALNISASQNGQLQDWLREAFFLDVEDGDFYHTGRLVSAGHRGVLVENKWSLNA